MTSVLIVDDSLTVRMDLKEAFEGAGYETAPAMTVAEARQLLQDRRFDLIILDVMLPDADGVDFLKELRMAAGTAEIPVILLSAEAEIKSRIRGLSRGADDYVGKPYERSYLLAKAGQLLAKRLAAPPSRGTPKILVIDDSATFRHALQVMLEGRGYDVLLAPSGEEGLHLAAAARPDAAIIDGVLPGIDGATVVRRLKSDAALRRMPCLLLTGSEMLGDELKALEAGADAYVRKEENQSIILARLTAMLRSTAAPADGDAADSLFGPKQVLAVDDSPTYLHELANQLRGDGYDVILAHSGEEALALLAVRRVDCVLLDLVMPGLSGQETCQRIKATADLRDIPLVMLTAREDQEAMVECFNAGADDYIPKSSEFTVLKARLRAQMRRKQFEDENRRIQGRLRQKEAEAADAYAKGKVAEMRAALVGGLEQKNAELERIKSLLETSNRELEAFSYSVSHDLRAPLRGIDGFSRILMEDYRGSLDAQGQDYLRRIVEACAQMGLLIDDLINLSRVTRNAIRIEGVNLSALAGGIADDLRKQEPNRNVAFEIADNVKAEGDGRLLKIVLDNLMRNAWKFSSKNTSAHIKFGVMKDESKPVYFVKDDGAGFDMAYSDKLFGVFQRLHDPNEFPGTGIGLATVRRVIERHGGEVWAEGEIGHGATFYFSLPDAAAASKGLDGTSG